MTNDYIECPIANHKIGEFDCLMMACAFNDEAPKNEVYTGVEFNENNRQKCMSCPMFKEING